MTMMTGGRWRSRGGSRRGPAGPARLARLTRLTRLTRLAWPAGLENPAEPGTLAEPGISAEPGAPAVPQVVWVYGVTDSLRPGQIAGLTGVGGERVRALTAAGLTAVVGSVDAPTFGEHALATLLADLTRIELIGRVHHQVITSIAAAGPVLPLRLATICPDDGTVRRLLEQRSAEFAVLLNTLRGMEEWGVKVFAGAGAGRDGLAESEEASVEMIDRTLSGIAIAARRNPPEEPLLADATEWMIFNGAYLIRGGRAAEFTAATNALAGAHPGLQVRLTGPWPPYSFADSVEA